MVQIQGANGYMPHEIDVDRTYRSAGNIYVLFHDKVSYIEVNKEYVIWKDGELSPQKTNHLNGY